MKKGLLAAFATFYLLANPVFAQISGWITTNIASQAGMDLGHNPSMVVDSDGFVHIVHTALNVNDLRYTSNRTPSGAFATKQLFAPQGPLQMIPRSEGDIAISGTKIIVCFYQPVSKKLGLAEKNLEDSFFTSFTLLSINLDASPAQEDVGKNCSIAVDSSNGIHISYWNATNKKIRYLYRSTNPAQNQGPLNLPPNPAPPAGGGSPTQYQIGPWNSLAVTPNGTAHITYYYDQVVVPGNPPTTTLNQRLVYSTKTLASASFPINPFNIQGLAQANDSAFGRWINFAVVDSSNKVHVCYLEEGTDDTFKLRYATDETIPDNQIQNAFEWPNVVLTEILAPEGRHCSIFFEAGRVHVVYVEQTSSGTQQILYRSKALGEPLSEPQVVTQGNISDIDLFVQPTNGKVYAAYLRPSPNMGSLGYTRTVLCGDQACENQETCANCETDCGICPPTPPQCGNGICETGETCDAGCPEDCGPCEEPPDTPQTGGTTPPPGGGAGGAGGGTGAGGAGGGGDGGGVAVPPPGGTGCQLILKR